MADGIDLTPRQEQVLELLDAGLDYTQTASELSISKRTVHRHVYNVADQLGGPHPPLIRVLLWYRSRRGSPS